MTSKTFSLFLILFFAEIFGLDPKQNEKSGEKIVNGQLVTSREAFPFHVALLLKKSNVKEFVLCGGKKFK